MLAAAGAQAIEGSRSGQGNQKNYSGSRDRDYKSDDATELEKFLGSSLLLLGDWSKFSALNYILEWHNGRKVAPELTFCQPVNYDIALHRSGALSLA